MTAQTTAFIVFGALPLAIACSSADESMTKTGSAIFLLEPEDTIQNGIDSGAESDSIQDGWTVRYHEFIANVGNIQLINTTDINNRASEPTIYTVDLSKIQPSGIPLWTLEKLSGGRYDVGYNISASTDQTVRHESISQSRFNEINTKKLSYALKLSLTKPGGTSCPPPNLVNTATPSIGTKKGDPCYKNESIEITIEANIETNYSYCAVDNLSGIAVNDTNSVTAALTIHGDHIFFNGFPQGEESGTKRFAQWLADCDLNLDGQITSSELSMIKKEQMKEFDTRYQLGGAPISIHNMLDYVQAQLKTQGHFQGEGTCAFE